MRALADDFELHGKAAIDRCREETPAQYLKIIASLMPNELEVRGPFDEYSDEQLASAMALLTALIEEQEQDEPAALKSGPESSV